jgi:hypothetical protein
MEDSMAKTFTFEVKYDQIEVRILGCTCYVVFVDNGLAAPVHMFAAGSTFEEGFQKCRELGLQVYAAWQSFPLHVLEVPKDLSV